MSTDFNAYLWNPYSRTFVPVTGKPVTTKAVRKTVSDIRNAANERIKDLAKQVQSGELTNLAEFKIQVAKELKNLYTATHVLARGGVDQMDSSSWGMLGAALREQYDYLGNFVRDIENARIGVKDDVGNIIIRDDGLPELGDAFIDRADLYTDSAWGAAGEFESVIRDRESEFGSLERRVLGDSKESCADCIEAADQGWQPAGVLPDIGDTECGPGCNCEFEFENAELDALNQAFDGELATVG